MLRVHGRRLCCIRLAAALLLVSFVQVLWSPLQLGVTQHHVLRTSITVRPVALTESSAEEGAELHCSDLNATSVDGVRWTPVPSPQLGEAGPYCVLYDWLLAALQPAANQSVTLCTHATADGAAQHAPLLAAAWSAPVSLAVFVLPGEAGALAGRLAYLRRCDAAFRRHVSVHLVFERRRRPALARLPAVAALGADCGRPPPPAEPSRRRQLGLPYPVNVARNAARRAARTRFVLVSDAELVPSPSAATMFMDMLARQSRDQTLLGGRLRSPRANATNKQYRRVYVLPVFEVQNRLPTSKADLIRMAQAKEAVWFHRYVCPHCQKFPGVNQYFSRPFTPGRLQPLSIVKREVPYHRWEPIYIGTQAEPLYDERLSWEGKQDKMTQMTELCLRGYRLVILDQVFLTHVPQPGGIRRRPGFTDPSDAWRARFVSQNQRVYDSIIHGLKLKYGGDTKRCVVNTRKVKKA
ncbi:Beta-1,4-glucuronyltransferase 1 [Amphibalanus amphitrite]|uniref:Beta-1,4-glucuronyltransferase 1 n=1 Tax=Amphibalanus amphitrite TaxID=1232801 RepID=A0A6A4X0U6_AMPAM|nr:Beta-1,4-glucuronyltransferase 1 [Amphibalanus amphitrite]